MKKFLLAALIVLCAWGMTSCDGEFDPAKTGWKGSLIGTVTNDGEVHNVETKATLVFGNGEDKNGFIFVSARSTDENSDVESFEAGYPFTYKIVDQVGTLTVSTSDTTFSIPLTYNPTNKSINLVMGFMDNAVSIQQMDLKQFQLDSLSTLTSSAWSYTEEDLNVVAEFTTENAGVLTVTYTGEDGTENEKVDFSYSFDGTLCLMRATGGEYDEDNEEMVIGVYVIDGNHIMMLTGDDEYSFTRIR